LETRLSHELCVVSKFRFLRYLLRGGSLVSGCRGGGARCECDGLCQKLITHQNIKTYFTTTYAVGSRVVSVLDSGAEGPGFKSQSRRCRETVLGKLITPIVPRCSPSSNTGSSPLTGCEGNCRTGGRKVMAAYRRVYDSRHLQADCQEPGLAPEPMLGNRV